MAKVRALVITGYGLNCEAETSHVLQLAGAQVDQVHLSDMINGAKDLDDYQLLVLIGGFSFGDHISAGVAFANRLRRRMKDQLKKFIMSRKLVIGICNGFQTLVKLGLLPGIDGDYETQKVTIMQNGCGFFRNAWVRLKADETSNCIFTEGVGSMELPIRHGEGNFYVEDKNLLKRLIDEGHVALRYVDPETKEPTGEWPHNPNGSVDAIAGICDSTGRIFGMMPHPEAFWSPYNHPQWIRHKMEGTLPAEGQGMKIFRNAIAWLEQEM